MASIEMLKQPTIFQFVFDEFNPLKSQTFNTGTDLYRAVASAAFNCGFLIKKQGSKPVDGHMITAGKLQCWFARKPANENTTSHLVDCPFYIGVGHSKGYSSFHVSSVNLCHNHQIDVRWLEMSARGRGLSAEELEVLRIDLEKRVPFHKVLEEARKSSPFIQARDIHNAVRNPNLITQTSTENDFRNVVEAITNAPDFLHLLKTSPVTGQFVAFAFSHVDAIHSFSKMPNVVISDTTFKVTRTGYPLLAIASIDPMLLSFPIAYVLIANSKTETFIEAFRLFKSLVGDETAKRIKVFVSNQERALISGFSVSFPLARQQLCILHLDWNIHDRFRFNKPIRDAWHAFTRYPQESLLPELQDRLLSLAVDQRIIFLIRWQRKDFTPFVLSSSFQISMFGLVSVWRACTGSSSPI